MRGATCERGDATVLMRIRQIWAPTPDFRTHRANTGGHEKARHQLPHQDAEPVVVPTTLLSEPLLCAGATEDCGLTSRSRQHRWNDASSASVILQRIEARTQTPAPTRATRARTDTREQRHAADTKSTFPESRESHREFSKPNRFQRFKVQRFARDAARSPKSHGAIRLS